MCDICLGNSNCPCCSEVEECEQCENEGYYYIQSYYRKKELIEKTFTVSEMRHLPKICKDIFEKCECLC